MTWVRVAELPSDSSAGSVEGKHIESALLCPSACWPSTLTRQYPIYFDLCAQARLRQARYVTLLPHLVHVHPGHPRARVVYYVSLTSQVFSSPRT